MLNKRETEWVDAAFMSLFHVCKGDAERMKVLMGSMIAASVHGITQMHNNKTPHLEPPSEKNNAIIDEIANHAKAVSSMATKRMTESSVN